MRKLSDQEALEGAGSRFRTQGGAAGAADGVSLAIISHGRAADAPPKLRGGQVAWRLKEGSFGKECSALRLLLDITIHCVETS